MHTITSDLIFQLFMFSHCESSLLSFLFAGSGRNTEDTLILISNFRRVLNAVLCFLGNLPAPELLVPTFRNLLAVPTSQAFSVEVIPRIGVEGYIYGKCLAQS